MTPAYPLDVFLFALLAALCLGALLLVGVTLQRLSGRVSFELELGGPALARAEAEVKEARAAASALRAQVSDLTALSDTLQELQGREPPNGYPVTRDVTTQRKVVTVPLNAGARVTAYPENGEPFLVPQDGSSSPPVK